MPEMHASPMASVPPAMIQVRQLNKTVQDAGGPLTSLHDLDFDIARGSSTAIVGASGSGKSTLLSLLAGLDVPSSGSVLVDGQDLFALDEDARAALRARKMGFVFQNFQLMRNLTALENVMLPLELQQRRDARQAAMAMLERVGLGQRLQHYPRLMSGGEQQRVALARAFVVRPDILLADEPTGSLDHATGARVMALMMALKNSLLVIVVIPFRR